MVILLDFDGVLVTTPSWSRVEILDDGFLCFNAHAVNNLRKILDATSASIILSTTHRIRFSEEKWIEVLARRGIQLTSVSKINDCRTLYDMENRAIEIQKWIDEAGHAENYVILDDDRSLHDLPDSVKKRWIMTHTRIGLDEAAAQRAIEVLLQ